MEDLDSVDRKILNELDVDSRQAYSSIAKKVRTNKDTVKYRIEKLFEKGIIQGFYTIIDYSKLGFLSFRFYFQLSGASKEKKEEMINYLKNHRNVSIFYRITGHYDFSFSTWVRDPWEYELFWQGFQENIGGHLLNSHLALKTKYTEFSRNYIYGPKKEKLEFTVFQKADTQQLDSLDFRILNLLSRNARASLVEISEKVAASVVTCRARIKKLIKTKVIVGFRTMLNLEKLGYVYYKVDLWFSKLENKDKVMRFILSHPNVIYTEKTIVSSDFEFDMEVKGFRHFIEIMDQFEVHFPDSIKRYEYYTLIENYKVNYLASP